MQLRGEKINIVTLDDMDSAFRKSVTNAMSDGIGVTLFMPSKVEVYNLKAILINSVPKLEHTCNGERYLTDCKACKVLSWRLQGLSNEQVEMLLTTENDKSWLS